MKIKTPCIGICSTVYGDQVCRGCNRFQHEVIDWNGYTQQQQQLVWQRLEQITALVISRKLRITDQSKLEGILKQKRLRYNPSSPMICWTLPVLNEARKQLKDSHELNNLELKDWGIELKNTQHRVLLAELLNELNHELFELSKAYYQKQFLNHNHQAT